MEERVQDDSGSGTIYNKQGTLQRKHPTESLLVTSYLRLL